MNLFYAHAAYQLTVSWCLIVTDGTDSKAKDKGVGVATNSYPYMLRGNKVFST